ncbi:putative Phox domain, multihem cytochrome, PX domain superfamily [Helianthus annuus]|nr:putative Phox domain, multihem cytochrome, PX domain superfamily [Helianthus annuus]
MMNGEGTSETVSLNDKFTNELSTWKLSDLKLSNDRSNDASPVSSRYSSCGESEFDRYCSANSAMGTPSLCSSVGTFHDFGDSDIGSVKSSRFGDLGSLESFSLGGKFENKNSLALGKLGEYSQKTGEKSEQRSSVVENEMNPYDETEMKTSLSDFEDEGGVVTWKPEISSRKTQSNSTDDETMEKHVVNVRVEERSESCLGVDEVNNVFEGETSSQLEHSESEGSMYGYGTDNEEMTGLPFRGYGAYSHEKKKSNDNSLVMTSTVAYGSDDWDDYMQETMGNPQDLFVKDEIPKHNLNEIGIEDHTSKPTVVCESIDVSHEQENVTDIFVVSKQAEDFSQLETEEVSQDVLPENEILNGTTDIVILGHVRSTSSQNAEEVSQDVLLENKIFKGTTDNSTLGHVLSTSSQDAEDHAYSLQALPIINAEKRHNVSPMSMNIHEDIEMASKVEDYELNEFFDEVVFEMEEILLNSGESPAARFRRGRDNHNHVSLPSRDGGSTASTSSIDNHHASIQNPYKIDGIEVIGAKQKKGDVSLGERLVGVKEYTVYKLRVWNETHQWEVERRYRDFFTLYTRLKSLFANKGLDLPSPWSKVERESRKYFGISSPDVVLERSVLIQECLQSILHSKFSSNLPSSVIWFLSPPKNGPDVLSQIGSKPMHTLGQSISLIVEIRAHKSMRQMLEGQHYTCAGCHKYFDEGKTRLWEFVQTFGWGKPRVCEYSGQVFCSSCHVNETAILPARVLHWWDFKEYPVSQLAKSYLDSIHDKPMLCVGAVNPFLFSKVPPLQHVVNVRKRIGRMLPYVRCPFRRSIYKGVGSRRYILESSDFFALKDLVDLSKGVFAALPVMVETISKKIVNHITDECLICYDVGVPCGARQACDDPSSLIFPFQEGEVERCKSCELVYHKACFKKMATCPCGVGLGSRSMRYPDGSTNEVRVGPNNSGQESSTGFLSGWLSKASSSKLWGTKDNDDTVIPMGSLPSFSL